MGAHSYYEPHNYTVQDQGTEWSVLGDKSIYVEYNDQRK
jgi:hypothetical protein